MKRLLLAVQFLTIIPVTVKGGCSEEELAHSSSFFPVAGALQGVLMALAAFASTKIFPVEIVSGFVILVLLLSDGGFDMDGLIDTFDGLAVKSTGDMKRDMEMRLSAMKSSSIGAVGAMALVMAVLLKFVLLNHLFRILPLPAALSLLFIIPAFSKWVTVIAIFHGRPARKDGLGSILIGKVQPAQVALSSLILLVLCVPVSGLYLYPLHVMPGIGLFAALFPLLYLLALVTVRVTVWRFGGLTGDHCGALSEISEILLMAAIPVWLQHST
ncbi:MAG TPA: adenosylcobinamide-GDP ribazoletransferase [Dissulfurispiraceae bacterium]|nr:adenosylcobinamide-GDP ribazoletransferase [Dissulfurispiraceae bacterium]